MLTRLSRRMMTQNQFNLNRILENKETPKLKLFSKGQWVESNGAYESIPFPLDKRINIAESPCLNLPDERGRIKQSMQEVFSNHSVQNPDYSISTKTHKSSEKSGKSSENWLLSGTKRKL